MATLCQDLRYALRLLLKNPAFTSVSVLTLALGIAATTAMFALVDAALPRPLPYTDPSRLVAVFDSKQQNVTSRFDSSYPDLLDWRRQNTTFSSLAEYVQSDSIVRLTGAPELVPSAVVTANFFKTLGVQPALGRDFHDGGDNVSAEHVVLLSYPAFEKRFGGRAETLGRKIVLNDEPATIVGVLLRGFLFAVQAWDPMAFAVSLLLLATVEVAASSIPAWRATRVNPIQALRDE